MPDYNQLLVYPQIGPALSATTWVGIPVVGATHSFVLRVTRKGDAVSGATGTVRVEDASGTQVYPLTGTITIPADPDLPGTYSLTPASTGIFSQAGALYTAYWSVLVPAAGSDPPLVLPLTQKLIAQAP